MKVAITGGAGFIGCNTAKYYIDKGEEVVIIDDLSRTGTEKNLEWLETIGDFAFYKQDIRDREGLQSIISECGNIDLLCHLAGQVAVTTSVSDPVNDFEINARGTFNVLESVRKTGIDPVIIYSSTNKVYGEMGDISIIEDEGRYAYDGGVEGISENMQLDFHSPYGCSKGAADQYVIDYARIYGLKTVALRQSCIYGPRQFGVEDQGWVAWFTIAAALDKDITIYGDGKQVRDILYVQDLVELYNMVYKNIDKVKGKAFNVGGGPVNEMSLIELISILEDLSGKKMPLNFSDWRPGDQKIYVSDITRVKKDLGWEPGIHKVEGIKRLWGYVNDNVSLFK
jgi:CDP-paratose 2-epimerase